MLLPLIHTRINSVLGVVFNESDGSYSKEDTVHALIRTEELGRGDCAVLWDLRKSDSDQFGPELLNLLTELLKSKVFVPSVHHRAIVVKDSACRERIEVLIRKLSVPWPWIVLTDLGEAVTWIGFHQGDTNSGRF